MSHSLVEISCPQWTQLRDLYINKREFASAYNLLQNFINWNAQNPEVDVTIYSLDGDWQQDGTFLAKDHLFIYCNTLSDSKDRLLAALNCLDKNVNYLIAGFQKQVLPTVLQHFLDLGNAKEMFKPEGTFWYHLSKEQAKLFSIVPPEGYTLSPLDASHTEQINAIWPHRAPNSEEFVARLIRYNDNVGVFDREGNLVAWCLQLPLGSLGVLQVLDTHKRLGLGSLLVRQMAKLAAAKNLVTLAPVVCSNTPSRTMFEKLGFKIVDEVYWAMSR